VSVDAAALQHQVDGFTWYHTLDLGNGVVTPGMFDHRPAVSNYMLPDDLSGQRCLDVGTMDGFWAFEMERRGAAEVLAADLSRVDELDWPVRWRPRVETTLDATKEARFRLAHGALNSNVERIERSVYGLGEDLGAFDLVFCGDLLVHLKDPITAIERIHSVCRGSAIICNPIRRFRFARGRALAQFDGIDEFRWWELSEASLERMMLATGFDGVRVGRAFNLPTAAPGKWKGRRGIVRGYVNQP
jgi:tRNA (mo5U34)-methyltransferase